MVQGQGIAQVCSVGIRTEMGKIGKVIGEIQEEDSLLKKETGKIVRNFSIAGIVLCSLVVLIYGFTRGIGCMAFFPA